MGCAGLFRIEQAEQVRAAACICLGASGVSFLRAGSSLRCRQCKPTARDACTRAAVPACLVGDGCVNLVGLLAALFVGTHGPTLGKGSSCCERCEDASACMDRSCSAAALTLPLRTLLLLHLLLLVLLLLLRRRMRSDTYAADPANEAAAGRQVEMMFMRRSHAGAMQAHAMACHAMAAPTCRHGMAGCAA